MTTRKIRRKKFDGRSSFPLPLSIHKPPVLPAPPTIDERIFRSQQPEDTYIVTYSVMTGNEKQQSSGSNSLKKHHFSPTTLIRPDKQAASVYYVCLKSK
ncbi:MAG: hypothetical protein D3910_04230 [Candidatus Electrothrix sp. ATG2]|nr:hypothetical protein [Candidatus Electrothrix sp. ATG2]